MEGGKNVPISAKRWKKCRKRNNESISIPTFVDAQCIIGNEKNAKVGANYFWRGCKNSQAYGEVVSCPRHLAKDNICQLYITQKKFKNPKTSEGGAEVSYKLYVFDLGYQRNYTFFTAIKIQCKLMKIFIEIQILDLFYNWERNLYQPNEMCKGLLFVCKRNYNHKNKFVWVIKLNCCH